MQRVCDVTGMPMRDLQSDLALPEVVAMWAILEPYVPVIDQTVHGNGNRVCMEDIMWWCAPMLSRIRVVPPEDIVNWFGFHDIQQREYVSYNVTAWVAGYVCLWELCGDMYEG
jgi:hypothetical protein